MSVRRIGWLAVAGLAALVCISCGQVYRPVVLPVATTPPNPAGFHAVFGISTNIPGNQGTALQIDVSGDSNIGQANMGINPTHAAILPNDSRVFVTAANTFNPATNSLNPGGVDTITAFTPAVDITIATGLGTPTIFSYPNVGTIQSTNITAISEDGAGNVTVTLNSALSLAAVGKTISISGVSVTGANPAGYDGNFTISAVSNPTTIVYVDPVLGLPAASAGTAGIPLTCSYRPDFVTAAQATTVFVANYGFENDPNCNQPSTDSVALLNASFNTISVIQNLPPASHPVAMVETPDAQNLYVLNQNNTILDLSPTDLSTLANVPLPAGSTVPVWAAARIDSQDVYVVTQGDGFLHTISTVTNTVTSSQTVGGPGVNFILYDKSKNRIYVTNPGNGTSAGAVYVFDAATNPPTPLGNATGVVNIPAPAPCSLTGVTCTPVTPVSVAALPDGSRFYVASFVIASTAAGGCPDSNVSTAGCMIPQVTVFDAASLTVKPASMTFSNLAPSISLLGQPEFPATQYAVAVTPGTPCAPAATFTPETTRFRMFTAASADSSHVYVSICDAGSIADISATTSTLSNGGTNTPDLLVTDLPAPFSAAQAGESGSPPPQNPVFLLTGQ